MAMANLLMPIAIMRLAIYLHRPRYLRHGHRKNWRHACGVRLARAFFSRTSGTFSAPLKNEQGNLVRRAGAARLPVPVVRPAEGFGPAPTSPPIVCLGRPRSRRRRNGAQRRRSLKKKNPGLKTQLAGWNANPKAPGGDALAMVREGFSLAFLSLFAW